MSFLSCAEMLTYAHEQGCTLAQAVLQSDLAESRLTEADSRAEGQPGRDAAAVAGDAGHQPGL